MYRSGSWTRPEEYSMHSSPKMMHARSASSSMEELPVYDPNMDDIAKKEKSRIKFAENAVHVIPLVLLLCAFVLWFFSNPDIEVDVKGGSISAKADPLTAQSNIDPDSDSDGTQSSLLPVEMRENMNVNVKMDMPYKQRKGGHNKANLKKSDSRFKKSSVKKFKKAVLKHPQSD